MNKRALVGIITAGVLLLGVIGLTSGQSQPSSLDTTQSSSTSDTIQKATPVCDGTVVTTNCALDNVDYLTYVYHPAVAEVSHNETVTTYKQEITSYCTLCNDDTYSPSCATGRGTCSYHGGVQEWNAPRYSSVPEYSTKNVIDTPAQEAYYEKITK
jgi:hypothetical protein